MSMSKFKVSIFTNIGLKRYNFDQVTYRETKGSWSIEKQFSDFPLGNQ